jgi:hypothetical protein
MSTTAMISMVLILTTIIGGFIYFLSIAIKKEKEQVEE